MNSERLDNLFGEIRNEATETSVQEVGKWIAVSAASVGLFGLLSQFKLPLLLTKKFIIMTSIITTIGIAATAIILSNTHASAPIEKQPMEAKTAILTESKIETANISETSVQAEEISQIDEIDKIELLSPEEISAIEPEINTTPIAPIAKQETKTTNNEGIERSLAYFNKIKVGGVFQVFIHQGESESVLIKSDEETASKIKTSVKNEVLVISTSKGAKNVGGIQIYLTATDIKEIDISGACQVKSEDVLNAPELEINADGAASILLEMRSDALTINSSGAASLKLIGTATSVNIDASGASNIKAFELKSTHTEIDASGASNIQCSATENLIIHANDASNITYDGSPANLDMRTSISANVKQRR